MNPPGPFPKSSHATHTGRTTLNVTQIGMACWEGHIVRFPALMKHRFVLLGQVIPLDYYQASLCVAPLQSLTFLLSGQTCRIFVMRPIVCFSVFSFKCCSPPLPFNSSSFTNTERNANTHQKRPSWFEDFQALLFLLSSFLSFGRCAPYPGRICFLAAHTQFTLAGQLLSHTLLSWRGEVSCPYTTCRPLSSGF